MPSHSHITCNIYFYRVLLSVLRLTSVCLVQCISNVSQVCVQHVPPISASMSYSINMWWTVQVMQVLIVQFSHPATSSYFKYSPQHTVLRRLPFRLHRAASQQKDFCSVCVLFVNVTDQVSHTHTHTGQQVELNLLWVCIFTFLVWLRSVR
jgi:hypothetical protein